MKFEKQLLSLSQLWHNTGNMYDVLSEMQRRVSTHPVDKIAGMAYLLFSESIPAYYGTQSEEDAWMALMDDVASMADLLFLHFESGITSWRPTWKQVTTGTLRPKPCSDNTTDMRLGWIQQSVIEGVKTDSFNGGYIIESALVRGLSNGDSQGHERHGKLIVEDDTGTEHTIKIVAYHQCPIPDGSYTLLGTQPWNSRVLYWVVRWRLADQRFKKLSVFETYDDGKVLFVLWSIATTGRITYLA